MLKQHFFNRKGGLISEHKKYIFSFITLTLITVFLSLYCFTHDQNYEKESPKLSDTVKTIITGDPNKNSFYPCPKRHNISYIWMKGQMPQKYKEFITRCKDNVNIVTEEDFKNYIQLWNEKFPQYQIINPEKYPFVLQIEYLKKLHLYFKGGIYADFDTEIDQTCWEDVITDRLIFTNTWGTQNGPFAIPEQNFIKVPRVLDHRLQQWIVEHVHETRGFSNRWDQCRMEQCFIMLCQVHNYENTWVGK